MSAVKTLKGVTLALLGFGQSSRMARRGVQSVKGRKKGRRWMRKCIFCFLGGGGRQFIFCFKGRSQWMGIGKLEKDIREGDVGEVCE